MAEIKCIYKEVLYIILIKINLKLNLNWLKKMCIFMQADGGLNIFFADGKGILKFRSVDVLC